MQTILIVGGYGAVGRKIARHFVATPDCRIIIAGRSLRKAALVARPLQAEFRRIDITAASTWSAALEGVDLVIVCIDQQTSHFVLTVSQAKIGYIDVTANDDFFQQLENLSLQSPVLLSVGLAPGVSNLLTAMIVKGMDAVELVEIGLLMGTGDEHGSAAIAWSTKQMFDPSGCRDDKLLDFGPDFGLHIAHFMNFSDQHSLARTMPGVKAITRVTYDSRILTNMLFWLGNRFAGNNLVEKLVAFVSRCRAFGSEKCVLTVSVKGKLEGKSIARQAWFIGRREAAVTAAVAALMTEQMLAGRIPPGIWHSHQIVEPENIFASLKRFNLGYVSKD